MIPSPAVVNNARNATCCQVKGLSSDDCWTTATPSYPLAVPILDSTTINER
jgi:hypothetical protein